MPVASFPDAASAWFWASATLHARHDPGAPVPPPGPCRVEAVVLCLDRLYRCGTLELLHVRILRIWGWRGVAPNPARPRERCDWRLWREAMEALDGPLRTGGIVAGPRCGLPGGMLAAAAAGGGRVAWPGFGGLG